MTKQNTPPDGAQTPANGPEAEKVADQIETLQTDAARVEKKIADPATPPDERERLEERLGRIEKRQDELMGKLDQLIASPVAPSPRRTEEPGSASVPAQAETPAASTEAPAAEEDKPRGKAPVSRRWFGDRAYGD
jgi:hypothetical protein